ncbi:50S ribosomal protein L25 [candidate division WOR-3 bacterium]|nr:50S ribosomal protein L25 [candidate division WOR-3 bacterium]
MHKISLEVEKREGLGKNSARATRNSGFIPGVIYGHKEENKHFTVHRDKIVPVMRKLKGEPALIDLKFSGGENVLAVIKEYQKDPMTDRLLHLDLQLVHANELLKVTVPVITQGTPEGVKTGGILEIPMRELLIEALPDKLPEHIEIDVSQLKLGDKIHVSDVDFKEARCLNDIHQLIAAVIAPKAVKAGEEKPEVEPAEGAETETAEEKEE